jgi:hypothetical protein
VVLGSGCTASSVAPVRRENQGAASPTVDYSDCAGNPASLERRQDLLDVRLAARLHHDVEFRLARRQAGEQALVFDVDDVGSGRADHLRHAREHAGHVVDGDAELGDLAVALQAAQQHRRQHAAVDVAAADHHADVAVRAAVRECFITAAKPAAPAPSATSFCWAASTCTAVSMSTSSTSRMSSTSSFRISA